MGVPGTSRNHWNNDVRSSVLNGPLLGFDFDVKQTLRSRNVMIVAVSALAFGVGASLVKGNNAGIRDLVGNVFAPWLLVSFLGGAIAGQWRVVLGAVAGTATSLIALLGFYVTNSFVLELGPHGWWTDLYLAVESGYRYFLFALVSGPIFGALGVWWKRTRSTIPIFLLGSTFVLEPFLEYLRNDGANGGNQFLVGLIEISLGIFWASVIITRTKWSLAGQGR